MTATPIGPQNLSIMKGVVSILTSAPLIQRWQPSTTYAVGAQVINFNPSPATGEWPWSVYTCSTAGTSASTGGPTGITTAIVDGTAHWDYDAFTDVGEVEEFSTEVKDTRADYHTNRSGAVTIVATALTARVSEMSAKLKEMTIENLALCGVGSMGGTAPHRYFKLGDASPANMAWQFLGKNTIGNKFQMIIPRCQIIPGKLQWVSKEFADLPITGKNLAVDNDGYAFGYGAELNY